MLSFLGSGKATAASDCLAPKPYQLKTPPLTTDWTAKVGISPWPEYPRPLLQRENWMNLNGPWQFKPAKDSRDIHRPPFGGCGFASEILVPFPMESGLSGIMKNSMYSWYRKTFVVPRGWSGSNVLVNFGAVDYEATVFVNGKAAGFHRGGYFRFALDLTDALNEPGEENELLVFVYDPTNSNGTLIPTGKQVLDPVMIRSIWCGVVDGVFDVKGWSVQYGARTLEQESDSGIRGICPVSFLLSFFFFFFIRMYYFVSITSSTHQDSSLR
ncbi:hypothetical protein PGTUg99_028282 [Puccinia graminis f. sp. tritici]|nr:hypothetical protein PGTUg99_028282 [Puccinia graminis f. sp. tritici]